MNGKAQATVVAFLFSFLFLHNTMDLPFLKHLLSFGLFLSNTFGLDWTSVILLGIVTLLTIPWTRPLWYGPQIWSLSTRPLEWEYDAGYPSRPRASLLNQGQHHLSSVDLQLYTSRGLPHHVLNPYHLRYHTPLLNLSLCLSQVTTQPHCTEQVFWAVYLTTILISIHWPQLTTSGLVCTIVLTMAATVPELPP